MTLDRVGRSTPKMLALAEDLRGRGVSLRVLNLGGGDVDTATPIGSMICTAPGLHRQQVRNAVE
jgi:DNA invertase Pin-like site-specific DNA recombinase